MTRRHNKLANVVRRGIETFVANDLRSAIQENERIGLDDLPEDLRGLRPDMVFERRRTRRVGKLEWYTEGREEELRNEEKIIEIIEFSCPYGYISRGRDALERAYDEKKRKYMELALNLKRLRREEVRLTVVIVSSMGAVYDRSLKDLQRVLGCTDRKMRKLGRQMAETMIMGSMEIWRQNVHEIPPGPVEIANLLIEGEVAQLDEE
jgi:hypothetical protein